MKAVAQSMVRGAIRIAARWGSASTNRSATSRPRCGDIAVGQPGTGAHVPRGGREKITRRFEMFGDQGSILVSRGGIARLNRFSQTPMHLRAIGFQL